MSIETFPLTTLGAAAAKVVENLQPAPDYSAWPCEEIDIGHRRILVHEPGIYFGLPEERYYPDPALGYTDTKRLLISGADYWYYSVFNPKAPEDEETKARVNGHAFHTCVLFGRETFARSYDCALDKRDFPNALVTVADLKSALVKAGAATTGPKPELIARLKSFAPQSVIWDDLIEAQKKNGRTIIDTEEYNRIIIASDMMRLNPGLNGAFMNGAPEVSVFWKTPEGVRLRARFDYLTMNAVVDLKSFANMMDRPIEIAIRQAIFNRRYDLQASHYLNARQAAREFIREGRVFGEIDRDWLRKLAENDNYIFSFVFHTLKGAPIMRRWDFHPGSMVDGAAAADVEKALNRYIEYRKRFGDGLWVDVEGAHVMTDEDIPMWLRS